MATCSQTNIPILNQQVDPCNGIHTSTNCIFYPEAITYLFIEPNEDLTAVIQAMVLSLQSNNTRITQLEEENAVQQNQIDALEIDVEDLQDAVLILQNETHTLQDAVDEGNTIVMPVTVAKGIDITLANLSTVYQNGVTVNVPSQTGVYPAFQPAPDAFVANINGQTPGSLAGSVVGYLVDANGDDNIGFFAGLNDTAQNSVGYVSRSTGNHVGAHFSARKEILGVTTEVFKVENNGAITSNADATINNISVGLGGGNQINNTAVGYRALVNNTIGNENTAIGNEALRSNIIGIQNTAVGEGALKQNLSNENTAIGHGVLQLNSGGGSNTGLGAFSLNSNASGSQNTAIGTRALKKNTSENNTAVGANALIDNTTGTNNVAVGVDALHNNTVGTANIAIGVEALRKNVASSNLAIGTQALYNNTLGSYNVALGQSALFNNEAGNYNTAIGIAALINSETGSNNVAVGASALLSNKSGISNIGIGQSSLGNLKFGSNNIGIGINAYLLDKSDSGSIVIGNAATGIGSNKTVLGSPSTIQTFIRGRVTLGTTADNGTDILQATGSIKATQYKIAALNATPASATAPGTFGEIRYDANYIYLCVATNVWKRSALLSW
jgi:hypothetical protein